MTRKFTIRFLGFIFFIPIVTNINADKVTAGSKTKSDGFFDLSAESIDGKPILFSEYKGNVLLIVNTASQCGYTSQYKGLESIFQRYRDKGLLVLGFPSNDFGGQEPGSNKEIKKFCEFKFKVSFPMFAKVNINSVPKSSVYQFLTETNPNPETRKTPNWNFNKYLIDRKGSVAFHFPSNVEPDSKQVTQAIESLLRSNK